MGCLHKHQGFTWYFTDHGTMQYILIVSCSEEKGYKQIRTAGALYKVSGNSEVSQNHRMVKVGRDLWKSTGPPLWLKHSHLELLAQNHVQTTFEYLQGGRSHKNSGQPVSVLNHPHSEKLFPDIQREPPVFQFLSIASCPITGHQ